MRLLLYVLAAVLYLLHQDFWLWNDDRRWGGVLPAGFLYHLLYCGAASLLLLALTRLAWPSHLESTPAETEEAEDSPRWR